MKEEIIKHIGYPELIDMIEKTSERLLISLPNIDEALAQAIIDLSSRNDYQVKILTDNSESSFRNGFGDIAAIRRLKDAGVEMFELKGNMVSFIISDNQGYYLFPQSRMFAGDSDLSSNAVVISPLDVIKIKNYFFPPANEKEKEDCRNEIIDLHKSIMVDIKSSIDEISNVHNKSFNIEKINETNLENVVRKLEDNPPLQPDLKRQMDIYISKIQFVELSFIGINFVSKDVKIPSKILPYKDEEIKKKMHIKMKIFEDIKDNDDYKQFAEFTKKCEKLRTDFLHPIRDRVNKSIIKIVNKKSFVEKLTKLQEEMNKGNDKLKLLIKAEILKSKDSIKNELKTFLLENPPDDLKDYKSNDSLFHNSINDKVETMIKLN